ncbi:MAG: hypothetical protein QXT43_02705 [Candidatus Micrarchaeaceae archaeon]
MSFYGLFLIAVAFALCACVGSLFSALVLAGRVNAQYAVISEKTVLGAYANYVGLGYNGSYNLSGLLSISGMRIACAHGVCVLSNKYRTVAEAAGINNTKQ